MDRSDKTHVTFHRYDSFSFGLGNGSLISEALRHYQRLERQQQKSMTIKTSSIDKQNRRHHPHEAMIKIQVGSLLIS